MIVVGVFTACSSPRNEAYEQLKAVFEEGVQAQKSETYDEALDKYKYCIYECSSDQYLSNDSVKLLLPRAMGNLLNIYQSKALPDKCVAFFDSLRAEVDSNMQHHNRVLTQTFKRDVYVLLANAKKELADYLFQWQLYEDADKYISEAIRLMQQTTRSNPMVETVAYIIKAKVQEQKGQRAGMVKSLRKAQEISKTLPYNSGGSDIDLLMGKCLAEGQIGEPHESYSQGMRILAKVSHEATYKLRAQAFFEMAKASFAHGDEAYGGAALDSMYAVLNTINPPVFIEGAYEYALSHYLKVGDPDRIIRYSTAINRQKQMVEKTGTMKGVVTSLAHFEMEKQEKEMAKKMHEMEMRKSMEIIGAIVGILLLVGLLTLFIYKRKKMSRRHAQTVQQLTEVQVALAKSEEEKSEVESKLEKLETKEVDKVKAGISLQQLLAMRGDDKFKEYFNRAYPYFLVSLRKQVEHITSKEELYCMLIALGTTNEELASIFNVARSSIVVAKYRIRKKLNLEEGLVMEDYLANLLTKEEY